LGFGSFGCAPSLLNADFMRNLELTPQISHELKRLATYKSDGQNGIQILKELLQKQRTSPKNNGQDETLEDAKVRLSVSWFNELKKIADHSGSYLNGVLTDSDEIKNSKLDTRKNLALIDGL
jgi:hypothetical protein